jgi:hypothetical protein
MQQEHGEQHTVLWSGEVDAPVAAAYLERPQNPETPSASSTGQVQQSGGAQFVFDSPARTFARAPTELDTHRGWCRSGGAPFVQRMRRRPLRPNRRAEEGATVPEPHTLMNDLVIGETPR